MAKNKCMKVEEPVEDLKESEEEFSEDDEELDADWYLNLTFSFLFLI